MDAGPRTSCPSTTVPEAAVPGDVKGYICACSASQIFHLLLRMALPSAGCETIVVHTILLTRSAPAIPLPFLAGYRIMSCTKRHLYNQSIRA